VGVHGYRGNPLVPGGPKGFRGQGATLWSKGDQRVFEDRKLSFGPRGTKGFSRTGGYPLVPGCLEDRD
jgi:hypothetical protein